MKRLQISGSARPRRTAAALGVTTAIALATTLALAAPAHAADPAVATDAQVDSSFVVDGACTVTSGTDLSDSVLKTVASKGTQKVDISATGTVKAEDGGDPADKVTMKAAHGVSGSITGTGGAFSKAAFTVEQSGSIVMAQGFSTACDPAVDLHAGLGIAFTVKKAGKLSMRLDLPRDTAASVVLTKDGAPQMGALAYNTRGTYTVARSVKPGSYVLVLESEVTLGLGGSQILLSHTGQVGFAMSYAKS